MYNLDYHPKWKEYFENLPENVKIRAIKRINFILENPTRQRHLKYGLPYFVVEFGQYRITYKVLESEQKIIFYFVGNHKEYEKWYSSLD